MWHKIRAQFQNLIGFSLSFGFKYIQRYRCMILLFLSFVILGLLFFPENQIILRLGMHGLGKTAAAFMSDAATCERRRCLRVGAASIFFPPFPGSRRLGADSGKFTQNRANLHLLSTDSGRFVPTQHRLGPICAESGRFAPTRSVSGETTETHRYWCRTGRFRPKFHTKKKKKERKRCKTHRFNLNFSISTYRNAQWVSSSSSFSPSTDVLFFLFFLLFFTSSFSPPVVYLFK